MIRPPTDVRVACLQIAPVAADPEANRGLVRARVRDVLDSGAQTIVLPELVNTGYHLTPAEAAGLAEPVSGPSVSAWVDSLAGTDAVLVGGFCELGEGGGIYNSVALVSARGVLGTYRKVHLWHEEPKLFTEGTDLPPVFETAWGRIGLSVCYDLFFPELTRAVATAGAQLIVVPTNSASLVSRPVGDAAEADGIGHVVARSTAYLNRVFVAVCDRHGDERGHSWTSRSSIVGPEGNFLAGPVGHEEAMLLADCRLEDADTKVWDGTLNDVMRDRRPRVYATDANSLT